MSGNSMQDIQDAPNGANLRVSEMPPDNHARKSFAELDEGTESSPSLLQYIESHGIGEALNARPALLSVLCRKVGAEGPLEQKVYRRFMRFYWEGVRLLVEKSPTVKDLVTRTMPLTVNMEATDSSLSGHFQIRNGVITGGAGMVLFREQDFRVFGPTRVLMMFLNNELPLGYADLSLHSEGHPGLGRILFPVMKKVAELTKGAESAVSSAP